MHTRIYSGEETGQNFGEIIKLRGRKFICFLFYECVIHGRSNLHGIAKIWMRVHRVHTVVSFTRSVKILLSNKYLDY